MKKRKNNRQKDEKYNTQQYFTSTASEVRLQNYEPLFKLINEISTKDN